MDLFQIIKPGFFTTIQDQGRFGYRHLGVPVSGAMDIWAFKVANALVGNDPKMACLETTMSGPVIKFLKDCIVAVTGADMDLDLSGRKMPMWESFFCASGDILSFGSRKSGCRCYMAVSGGIDVPEVLGSRSTYVMGKFGGLNGRKLEAGDVIRCLSNDLNEFALGNRFPAEKRPLYNSCIYVKVIRGINIDLFTEDEFRKFLKTPYKVTARYDRMGCCLESVNHLSSSSNHIKESTPVNPGTIQVFPSGQPVVLLNDAQSTGGYPQIASVISSELWKIGQAVPGNIIYFQETDINTAYKLMQKHAYQLQKIEKNPRVTFSQHTVKNSYEVTIEKIFNRGE